MRKIILATHNRHKLAEVRAMLAGVANVVSLTDLNLFEDIPETGNTFAENAAMKARFVREHTAEDADILADDSGLEVMALNGAPGVYSARYAGPGCSDNDNIAKLLDALHDTDDRRARFVTVLALMHDHEVRYFEGEVRGRIIRECRGTEGFGYDPIFLPEGQELTFAELSAEAKNQMSHRARAIQNMIKSFE